MLDMRGGVTRLKLLAGIFAVFALLLPSIAQAATLSELLRQQGLLQQQQQQKEQALKQKQAEARNLNSAIDSLEGSIEYTQSRISSTEEQINLANAVISQLDAEIAAEQAQLNTHEQKLRNAYIALYELSRTSSTEKLAQGDSLSDIVSHEMYVQAIQDQLQRDILKSNQLLAELGAKKDEGERQRQDLDSLKSRLAADKSHLDRQRGQKAGILLATQRDQAQIEADLKKLESQREQLSADIYEARRREGGQTSTGGNGGYYWSPCGGVDDWLFYICQCTSFAADRFLRNTGLVFYNTRPGQGSAWNWPALAADQGYTVSSSPRVGDIVSWPRGTNMPYGHVAIVTGVHGGLIDVEEYNWVVPEGYSQRFNINPYAYGTPRYIRP
jgi:surface antigen